MTQKLKMGAIAGAEVVRGDTGLVDRFGHPYSQKIVISSQWTLEHWRRGKMLKKVTAGNLCPDQFINHVLDVALSGGTPITAWYVGLIWGTSPTIAAANTYASHSGWTEAGGAQIDGGGREAWSEAGVSSKVITNAASKASFLMDAAGTVSGCALFGGGTAADTAGDAAGGGTLGPVAVFVGGDVGVAIDDTIKVYMSITGSDV